MTDKPETPNNINVQGLKYKIASYWKLAKLNNWCSDFGIYISYIKDDLLIVNNPLVNSENANSDNLLEINWSNPDFDKLGVHVVDFLFHILIHSLRTKDRCVIFVDCRDTVEILIANGGMRPISQESMLIGAATIGTFDYEVFARDILTNLDNENKLNSFLANQKEIISKLLKHNNKLYLTNRGFVALGLNVEESWLNVFQMIYAMETHIRLGPSMGSDKIVTPSLTVQSLVRHFDLMGQTSMILINKQEGTSGYLAGEMEFEAEMRFMDSIGMDTGYTYKEPKVWKTSSLH